MSASEIQSRHTAQADMAATKQWWVVNDLNDLSHREISIQVDKMVLLTGFAARSPVRVHARRTIPELSLVVISEMEIVIGSLQYEDGSGHSWNFVGHDRLGKVMGWLRTDRVAGYVQRVRNKVV